MTDEMSEAAREKRHKLMAHMDRRGEIVPGTSLAMGGDMIPRAEADAMVAAAYEAAAVAMGTYHWNRYAKKDEGGTLSHPAVFTSHTHQHVDRAIRALTPADARAALDRLIADRVAKATTPKLLVWWDDRRHAVLQRLVSETVLGEYRIETGWANWQVSLNVPGEPSQWHPTVEAAKAAAEKNQICRIRAALKGGTT